MDVAILYSGGKDSNYAVKHALDSGWNIKYLLSVKPARKDCFLFHFATVEHTNLQAKALGLRHYLLSCNFAHPKLEADIVRRFVIANDRVDAVILGGTGLQATQIRSIREALMPYGIEAFAAHSGQDHFDVLSRMVEDGFEIMITQVAAEGALKWLGKTLSMANLRELEADARKHGFHVGGEGGHFDTFVVNAPTFSKRIHIQDFEVVREDENCGHVVIRKAGLADDKSKLLILE